MKTHCNQQTFKFQTENTREVVAHFNGGTISSDAGGLLLQEAERATGIIAQFAACFTDYRVPELTEHSVKELARISHSFSVFLNFLCLLMFFCVIIPFKVNTYLHARKKPVVFSEI